MCLINLCLTKKIKVMKKRLFFATVVTAALVGCSSNENLENDLSNVLDSEQGGLVPVELGLTRNDVDVYKTRGTGTVGDVADATNLYQNEDLWVLMTNVPAEEENWGYTVVGELKEQFDGTFKSRPVSEIDPASGNPVWGIDYTSYTGGQVKYYPTNGTYSEFFAYHVDDAAIDMSAGYPAVKDSINPTTQKVVSKYVEFKINGTQDLLAGKAEKSEADLAIDANRGYSAKTARSGIIPAIPMKHLLTRLTFSLTPGHQNALGLIIDSIKIVSRSEGQLTVAYNEDGTKNPVDLIKWTQDENWTGTAPADSFRLKAIPAGYDFANRVDGNGDKVKLVDVNPLATISNTEVVDNGDDTYTFNTLPVGEAFFVQPNQTQFPIKIYYRFPYESGSGTQYYSVDDVHYVRLYDANSQVIENGLELGKSYHVNIIVYGLSNITLRTTLENWVDGGQIDIDTADPIHAQE